jgi:hypothetical protein
MVAHALTEEEEVQCCGEEGLNIGLSGEDGATDPHRNFIRQWVNKAAPLFVVAVGRAPSIGIVIFAQDRFERPDDSAARHPTRGQFTVCVSVLKANTPEVTKSSGARRHVYE